MQSEHDAIELKTLAEHSFLQTERGLASFIICCTHFTIRHIQVWVGGFSPHEVVWSISKMQTHKHLSKGGS